MPGINANTFKLFGNTADDRYDDLIQSVRDRILTILGRRKYHSTYGSLARFHPGQVSLINLEKSIFDALDSDPHIRQIQIQVIERIIYVRINNQVVIQIASGTT